MSYLQAQLQMESQHNVLPISQEQTEPSAPAHNTLSNILYPSLGEYMGLELTEETIARYMPECSHVKRNVSNIIGL